MTKTLTVRVPEEIHEALRTLAFATNASINELVTRSIALYLSDEGHRQAVESVLRRARGQYRVALGKLADM
jgi:predicted transcriptional regulator